MATYRITFQMPEAQTGVDGHYPKVISNDGNDALYMPNATMFAKPGDTIEYAVTDETGGSVSYNNTNVLTAPDTVNTDPDPEPFATSGTSNQSNGSVWSRTIPSTPTAEDTNGFTWFWFGTTVHSSGSGKKRSARAYNRIISATPSINGGTSLVEVNPGGTITFASTISGMPAASGGSGNRLYFSIFNAATGGSIINPSSYTGGGWDSDNNNPKSKTLGEITTGDTNCVLTIGSNWPTSTTQIYHVYLTHYTVADTLNGSNFTGNSFYDSAARFNSGASLQFKVVAPPTGTVTGLSLGDNVNATTLSQVVERNSGTITCSPSTFQPTSSVSNQAGAAGAAQRLGGTTNNYSTADLTLNNGDSVDFYMVGPAGYNATTTGRLTIAEDHADLSVITGSDPGGGDDGGGATAGTYGLKVLNSDGDQVFGAGHKGNTVILSETRSALAHDTNDGPFTLPIAAADNTETKTAIIIIDMYTGTSGFNWPNWQITRSGSTFTVKNMSGVSRPYRFIAIRI